MKFAYDWHSSAHVDQSVSAAGRRQGAAAANRQAGYVKRGGTRLGEVDRTRRGGGRVRGRRARQGKQPSLQQEEEGGKEKERARAYEIANDTKIRELTRAGKRNGATGVLFWNGTTLVTPSIGRSGRCVRGCRPQEVAS